MNENFNCLLDNLATNNFDENMHNQGWENFVISLTQSIAVCENNSDKIHQGGYEQDYWFSVLEELYSLHYKVREQCLDERKFYYNDIMEKVSNEIRELLGKMSSYVSIQSTLEVSYIIKILNNSFLLECYKEI